MDGGWGALRVDGGGGVRLWRRLDREAPGGLAAEATILAVDAGRPPLTATATLTVGTEERGRLYSISGLPISDVSS